jgi:hypothetical protein
MHQGFVVEGKTPNVIRWKLWWKVYPYVLIMEKQMLDDMSGFVDDTW